MKSRRNPFRQDWVLFLAAFLKLIRNSKSLIKLDQLPQKSLGNNRY